MRGLYILDGKTPVPCDVLMEWAKWCEKSDRTVKMTKIGGGRVHTVFLAIDHGFLIHDTPLLFETIIFGYPKYRDIQERYYTWEEAEKGHDKIVAMMHEETKL